jgi:hypothetical protein
MKAASIGVPVCSGRPDTQGGPCGAERTALMVDRSLISHRGDAMSPPVDHVQSDLHLWRAWSHPVALDGTEYVAGAVTTARRIPDRTATKIR